jgi:allantoin racemase
MVVLLLRILFINPVGHGDWDQHIRQVIESVKRPDVEAKVVHLSKGPRHLEYHYYQHLIMDELLQIIKKAEKNQYDAAVIGCFDDPGLRVARELVAMPVLGPGETCTHVAATLGHRFSIIIGRRKYLPRMEDMVQLYGLREKLASFRVIDFTVPQMAAEPERLRETIEKEAQKAIEEDRAEVIVLGCTMESGFMQSLVEKLQVPVLDAVVTTWKYAEMVADLYRNVGLTHGKAFDYESPPQAEGWLN